MPLVAVFGSSRTVPGTREWREAETLGAGLASAGLAVSTGGYGGSMEAVSAGARRAGGHVIGVTADRLFPMRTGANRHVLEQRDHPSLTARIGDMVDSADAWVVLPGSIGTATELLVAWNTNHIDAYRDVPPRPLVAVGEPWITLVPAVVAALEAPDDLVAVVADVGSAVDAVVDLLGRTVYRDGGCHADGSS